MEHPNARDFFDELDHGAGPAQSHGQPEEELVIGLTDLAERVGQGLLSEVQEFFDRPTAHTTIEHVETVFPRGGARNP
ncbi:hypothetical protein HNP84_005768 [Thermocatellispora tengchongensis]|uniref:Uncharacterized protein n=1 Tax=Thermocatellispora tengchongensis TaxID=1073253 RepID=A0A840P3Z5_9ACTN|nr:hypothetical protein [Thermocatellispora tengchongensis]